ncbi:MAG: DUF87 domain-containing protein [Acidimicrobiaceae bacterium]|nr:DUF87 domain-containing protein [Acidimicrobiaceae bacterium]
MLPSENGALLAMVTWVEVAPDSTPPSRFMQDHVDLPSPIRRLGSIPLGILTYSERPEGSKSIVRLERGTSIFPTVGDPVRLPTPDEMHSVLPFSTPDELAIMIGCVPLAANADLYLSPNRLFSRHLAILGNTGSGKSCSVAHLLRASALSTPTQIKGFNSIILDMNGEYLTAFDDAPNGVAIRKFAAIPDDERETKQFRVPYWLWNYQEWISFAEASPKVQAPQLRQALQMLRTNNISGTPPGVVQLIAGRSIVNQFMIETVKPTAVPGYLSKLENVLKACEQLSANHSTDQQVFNELVSELKSVLDKRRDPYKSNWNYGTDGPDITEAQKLLQLFDAAIEKAGLSDVLQDDLALDDRPIQFDAKNILDLLPLIAAARDVDTSAWVVPMIERLRIAMSDERLKSICALNNEETLESWLECYAPTPPKSQITIVDLSLVPSHILHILVSVFVRLLLESMERQHRLSSHTVIPRILVAEEAHALMSRRSGGINDDLTIPQKVLCRQAFERIAREGRKFGLSLVVASQRPSELSATVLSQANTFLIHRIVNDHDQQLISKLVPDNLGTLMNDIPSLPTQTAILLGWGIELPLLIRIPDLAEAERPDSSDINFVPTWEGHNSSVLSWNNVVSDWIRPKADS